MFCLNPVPQRLSLGKGREGRDTIDGRVLGSPHVA